MSEHPKPQTANRMVLLIDDDEDDMRLISKQIQAASPNTEVQWVDSGTEALQLLRGEKPSEPAALRPSLILLDLNMPLMDGFEILQAIKTDEQLVSIPLVILSTSDDPQQVVRCYASHANGYVVKPGRLSELRQAIQAICDFWLEVATHAPCSSTTTGEPMSV